MRAATTPDDDRLEEMNDGDVETLIRGGVPSNTDLIPLRVIVAELRSLAHWTISDSFIEFHAAEAAELCAARHVPTPIGRGHGHRVVDSVRRRTATAAATLAMLASATGVAVASDSAVPGDWNYGIDLALEVVGIGAGDDGERLHELEVLEGLDVVIVHSSEGSARVTQLLGYLKDADSVDGSSVSEIAGDGAARPEDPGAIGRANKPEDPGAAGSSGQPEDPGAIGRANKPEDPGASGRAGKPEDPGAERSSGQAEDPGGANNPKKAPTP